MSSLGLTYEQTDTLTIYAGYWIRVLAKLVDWLVLSICFLPFDLLFGTSFVYHPGGLGPEAGAVVFAIFSLYSALMESSRWQATLGKRLAGVVVQDSNGDRISFFRAFARAAVQVLSTIDYLFVLFTHRKRALHDLLAETVVVYGTIE